MSTESEVDYLGMSDEDILKAQPPEPAATTSPPGGDGAQVPSGSDGTPPAGEAGDDDDGGAGGEGGDPAVVTPPASGTGEPPAGGDGSNNAAAGGDGGKPDDANGGDPKPKDDKTPPADAALKPDALAFAVNLAKAMQEGIRANGKILKIESPEEGVKLMQMGANFTQKMQQLAPAMRIVKMLQNNELLDEGKISFLIDLNQKNPAAIQRLLADSEFDPLSVDKAKADGYVPGDHGVSDLEVQFQSALDDLIETPDGIELLKEIQGQWDQESKRALLKEPNVVSALHLQRSNGIYMQIKNEIDRLSALGQIPVGTPFLQAYRGVGEMMQAQGKFGPPKVETPGAVTPPAQTPQGQAPAANTPPANRGPSDAARAAAPVKQAAPKTQAPEVNFLALSDDEFIKKARV